MLIGAKLAGILGALGAIPVAGAIQVILIDWQQTPARAAQLAASDAQPRNRPAAELKSLGRVRPMRN